MKGLLLLEDGTIFPGDIFNKPDEQIGEVMLNTAVVGYQEMITDPANAGKILVLTYPLIGNYGIAPKFNESSRSWLSGLVIKESSRIVSNWQAQSSLADFIKKQKITLITGIDTRTLAVHLRKCGTMLALISTSKAEPAKLLLKIRKFASKQKPSRLKEISVEKFTHQKAGHEHAKKIGIIDLGITNSILRQLKLLGAECTIMPYGTKDKQILGHHFDALVVSGGPEEDPEVKGIIPTLRKLIGKIPIMGIATGHQMLAKALGAKLFKMKLGHHGVNYPVRSPSSGKAEITVQNHAFAVDADSLSKVKGVKITGYHLNDSTVEEFESKKLKLLGIQYNPASPGFEEINPAFVKFYSMLQRRN